MGDDFESLYKGEISKSGTPILPSKRARKTPEKIQLSKEDLDEISQASQPKANETLTDEVESNEGDVSLDQVSENENQQSEENTEDSEGSNT